MITTVNDWADFLGVSVDTLMRFQFWGAVAVTAAVFILPFLIHGFLTVAGRIQDYWHDRRRR